MITVKVGDTVPIRVSAGDISPVSIGVGMSTVVVGDIETYNGEYEVTPLVGENVVLPTSQKRMKDDVTVKEVPIYRTSNEKGTTVYIGSKVDG